ncbi:MAG: hypothetical protein RIG67_10520 [Rhodospirillales bacterium]
MSGLTAGGWALCLAAADAAAIIALFLLIGHRARAQRTALDDTRHEIEADLAFLGRRLRARPGTADKLPPIDDEGI